MITLNAEAIKAVLPFLVVLVQQRKYVVLCSIYDEKFY